MDDVDSEGKGPNMPPGTRVVFMPDRDDTKLGTIERQILHYDGGETFWGNVRVRMDDGRYLEANCWQCKKADSQCLMPQENKRESHSC